jgi:hypothetical protein
MHGQSPPIPCISFLISSLYGFYSTDFSFFFPNFLGFSPKPSHINCFFSLLIGSVFYCHISLVLHSSFEIFIFFITQMFYNNRVVLTKTPLKKTPKTQTNHITFFSRGKGKEKRLWLLWLWGCHITFIINYLSVRTMNRDQANVCGKYV